MGAKTLSEFRTDLTTYALTNRDDLTTAQLTAFVNNAYIDFTTRNQFWGLKVPQSFDFPELKTTDTTRSTVANAAYITAPADALTISHIWDSTNDKKLSNISLGEYVKKTGRATTASYGDPTKWVRYGTRIYFYPTPDATNALTIYYRKRPAEMSADADVTAIDAMWDEPIQLLCGIKAMMRFKMYELAEEERKEWLEMMSGKFGFYAKEERDRKTFFEPDPAYADWDRGYK